MTPAVTSERRSRRPVAPASRSASRGPELLAAVEDERWREALATNASTWKRAYALEPATPGDRAIDLLSRGVASELADLEDLGHCPVCDSPLAPVSRGRDRVYCSPRCLKVAANRRELLEVAA